MPTDFKHRTQHRSYVVLGKIIKHLFRSGHDCGRQFCFYKRCDEYGEDVHCVTCHRLSSHKDNTVGNTTDLPPFNGPIIKNDGQIKIEELNIATQDSLS